MADTCRAKHPDQDLLCIAPVNENHPVHYAWPDVQWDNSMYVPPPRTMTKADRKEKGKALTEHVKAAVEEERAQVRVKPKTLVADADAAKLVTVNGGIPVVASTPGEKQALARSIDPDTSWMAAMGISHESLTETQQRVLHILHQGGSLIDEEIIAAYRVTWPQSLTTDQSIRSRRKELVVEGLVESSGERGETSHGGASIRWRLIQ